MEHFNREQWKRYAEDLIDIETKEKMEEHLLNCDSCLELYTNIISEGLEINSEHPSPDFSHKVMKNIKAYESHQYKRKLLYYVAVASLTLMLTSSGLFNYIGNKFSTMSTATISKQSQYKIPIKFDWTDKLLNKGFNLFENITPVKDK